MKLDKNISVKEASEFLGISYAGDGERMITGINEIHKVVEGDLTFVDIEKYYQKALHSDATIILINKKVDCPEGKSLLVSDNPYRDYKRMVHKFWKEEEVPANNEMIHPEASIGEGTKIFPGSYIAPEVSIGKNCIIHPLVSIHNGSIIGDNVIIKSNTVIGGDAFYYKGDGSQFDKWPSCGHVIIHDHVHIGSSCTIDKGVSGDTVIGKHTKIDNQIHIAHGVEIGERCLFAAQVGIAGKTIIEDDVTVWGQVGIIKSIRVGAKATILSTSLVTKSVKGNATYYGNPAREVSRVYKEMAMLKQLPEWMKAIDEKIRK
jgi:UDP-3-O-[3-hydroxymyristoyl] glucosamine N-acyltransferase